MPRLIVAVLTAILFIYPIGIYFALQYYEAKYIGLVLFLLFAVRYFAVDFHKGPQGTKRLNSLLPITVTSGFLCLCVVVFNDPAFIRINPVLINLILLLTFAYTLIKPPSMIERFARLWDPKLPDEAIAYTKNVTKVWCGFFVLNGLIALYTGIFSSLKNWALYNGLIAYILMGLLFMFEYFYRQIKMKAVVGNK